MNKIQYITLLNMRGVTELKGLSIAGALRQTGGEPSISELKKVDVIIQQKIREEKLKKIKETNDKCE